MQSDIDQVLIPREQIAERVAELAARISRDLVQADHADRVSRGAGDTDGHNDAAGGGGDSGGDSGGTSGGASGGGGGGRFEVTLIPILTGSFIFVADLIRHLPIYMQIRLLSVSSYPGRSTSTRGASVNAALTNLPDSLEGQHVLVIDDILDSGNTLKLVNDLLKQKQPASLRTCVLLRKQRPEAMASHVDYVAFDIPDRFVVGYGLDYDDYYRNLPDIVTLRAEVVDG